MKLEFVLEASEIGIGIGLASEIGIGIGLASGIEIGSSFGNQFHFPNH